VYDKALLGYGPVLQQWKGSDHCYAMAQYTGFNNGAEDVFCGRCGGYITSDNSTEVQCRTAMRTGQSIEKSAEAVQFEVVPQVRNVIRL
jgi:hypothetical protein